MGVFRIRRQLRSYLLSRSLAPCCPHHILLYQLASLLSEEWAFHNEVAWVEAQVTGARTVVDRIHFLQSGVVRHVC